MPTVLQSKISDHLQEGLRSCQPDLQVYYQRTSISFTEQRLKGNCQGTIQISENTSEFQNVLLLQMIVHFHSLLITWPY